MPHIPQQDAPRFSLDSLVVTGLAAPSRGARETCVWRLSLAPGARGLPHSVDREEVFVALSGRATLTQDGVACALGPGDAFIVPAGRVFSLANPHDEQFEALAVLPVGGRAALPGGEPFSPPWAT